jgi:hypothetical protein
VSPALEGQHPASPSDIQGHTRKMPVRISSAKPDRLIGGVCILNFNNFFFRILNCKLVQRSFLHHAWL